MRGEAWFLFTTTALVLGLLVAHYLCWAFLQATIVNNPDGTTAILFWVGQVGSILVVGAFCFTGFRPALHVTVAPKGDEDGDVLALEQGATALDLPLDAIEQVRLISARQFHLYDRRYAATRIFAGRLPDTVLRLTTPEGPVIIALESTDDNKRLLNVLQTTHDPAAVPESTPAPS